MRKTIKILSGIVFGGLLLGAVSFLGYEKIYVGKRNADGSVVVKVLNEKEKANNFKFNPMVKPTDTNYSSQKSRSMTTLGDIESTWDKYQGEGTRIAVIDTGINYLHEDFYDDPTDYTTCHISKDSKSFELYESGGYYFVNKKTLSTRTSFRDSNWDILLHNYDSTKDVFKKHGTNVAASAAAAMNGVGTVGIAPKAEIVAYKTDLSFACMEAAIEDCIKLGNIDVINLSVGAYINDVTVGSTTTKGVGEAAASLEDVIQDAYEAGIIVVAAAGNENTLEYSYPACNTHVIGVGALGKNSTTKASYSNYNKTTDTSIGNHNVDISAPGTVYTSDLKGTPTSMETNAYCETQGTSFASPIVAGAACLFKEKFPNATPDQFEEALYDTVTDTGSTGWDTTYGYGRLDVGNLLGFNTNVESISLDQSQITLYTPNCDQESISQKQLTATITPDMASDKSVTWTSSNPSVATVTSSGLVKSVAAGETTITATTVDGGLTATCKVIVNQWINVISATLKDTDGKTSSTASIGSKVQLHVETNPSNATDTFTIFESSDTSVATVDEESGLVTCVGKGTATITAYVGNEMVEATYEITVTDEMDGNYSTFEFNVYDSTKLSTNANNGPSESTLTSNTYINGSKTSIDIVSSFTSTKAYYPDYGGIRLATGSVAGNITVTVSDAYAFDRMDIYGARYDTGASFTFKANNKSYTPISGDFTTKGSAIESIESPIRYNALNKATSFTISANTSNRIVIYKIVGYYKDDTVHPTSVAILDSSSKDITNTTKNLLTGDKLQLSASVLPADASNKEVTWSSSSASIATVSSTGLVTATGGGTATIKATTKDGGIEASITVVVKDPDSVTIDATKTVKVDESVTISASANGNVTWSTTDGTGSVSLSNKSNNGVTITGVSEGSATVTATCGTSSATCNVTVTSKTTPPTPSGDFEKLTAISDLKNGDEIVFACTSVNAIAGELTGSYLSSKSVTFSSNNTKITNIGDGQIFTANVDVNSKWSFSNKNGTLGCTSAKNLSYSSGTTTWTVSINSGDAVVTSTQSGYGKMQYNAGSPRFTTYTSGQTAIQIFSRSAGSADTPKEVTDVTVTPSTLSLDANGLGNSKTSKLTVNVTTTGSAGEVDETVTWVSGNPTVATVDQEGVVTAHSAGNAFITAKSNEDENINDSCYVTVTENHEELLGISITKNPTKTSYKVGDTFDPTGIEVMADYKYGDDVDVTSSVTYSVTGALKLTDTEVVVSYKDTILNITKTATLTIKVTDGSQAEQCTATITASDCNTSYGTPNSISVTANGDELKFDTYNVGHFSNNHLIQFKKSSDTSYLSNATALGKIVSITLVKSGSNAFKGNICFGSSKNPTDNSVDVTLDTPITPSGAYSYFKINHTGTAAEKIDSIVIVYEKSDADLDAAISWAKTFTNTCGCNALGTNMLSATIWSELSTSFNNLSAKAKAYITNATYEVATDKVTVTGTNGTNTDIAHAVSIYDYVVTHHGYSNFINRSISSSNNLSNSIVNEGGILAIIMCSFSLIGVMSLVIKKKHAK